VIDFSVPLAGIERAEASMNRSAGRIAKVGFPEGDSVDLSAEMVAMMVAKTAVQANANVLRAEADLSRSIVNLLG
jgi:flagellar basal body rod protein FlgG